MHILRLYLEGRSVRPVLAAQSWPVFSLFELLAEFSLVLPCMLCSLLCSQILARQIYRYKHNPTIKPLVNEYFGTHSSGIRYRKLDIKAAVALVVSHPSYLAA